MKNIDRVVLELMVRKRRMHEIMSDLCMINHNHEEAFNHAYERDIIAKRIINFSKSPLKAISDKDLFLEWISIEKGIDKTIYSESCGMLEDTNYKPCEDCVHMHEKLEGQRFSESNMLQIHCAYHPEFGFDAPVKRSNEILECRKNIWEDYYQRTKEDLESIKTYMKLRFSEEI